MDELLYRHHSEMEQAHWWFRARRQIVADVIEHRVDGPLTRILDVGCGTGGMLPMLARFGSVSGIELSAEAAAWCRERVAGAADVFQGAIPEAIPLDGYDLITGFDVIEHLDDDDGALRRIRDALRPGGAFVCTVPAFMFLWSPHDVSNHHKRRYTRQQLLSRLTGAGLTVEWSSYFNTWLFPLVAGARFLRRRSIPATDEHGAPLPHSDFAMPPRSVNGALRAIFASERFLLRATRLPVGVSIIAVARRGAS